MMGLSKESSKEEIIKGIMRVLKFIVKWILRGLLVLGISTPVFLISRDLSQTIGWKAIWAIPLILLAILGFFVSVAIIGVMLCFFVFKIYELYEWSNQKNRVKQNR